MDVWNDYKGNGWSFPVALLAQPFFVDLDRKYFVRLILIQGCQDLCFTEYSIFNFHYEQTCEKFENIQRLV